MSNQWEKAPSLEPIAIIGMAGRFPGAKNIDEFWQNLRTGVESISFFTDEELLVAGIDSVLLSDPNYVKAHSVLSDIEMFDAAFFDFAPREAELTDPQHRLFLECAWEALENAGWTSEVYEGRIGVYAGAGLNSYLLKNLNFNSETSDITDIYRLLIGNDKDFVPTKVSFQLNLKGPSVNVGTACSTSLVAVQMGCQSLLNYQCDMILAGGVSIRVPQKSGYLHQEGIILSPDGHCRAFDAKAKGTIGGNGVGIVVLKRLSDALADGDCIHAVIKGSAINNDGSLKVGYTAPSVDGQADVISEALALAEIEAETITYIETHGTGTPLGDPIEIAALKQAFSGSTQKKGYCAIGSLKTNIGHLDAAAGVCGLIKTVLALKHKQIPASLNFETPNPQIDFDNSPFYVNTKLSEWKTNETPRRAGVSSFGIGGTNAHVVLEEAPPQTPSGASRPWQILVISAKTATALDTATNNLAQHLQQHPEQNLADIAYTLSLGRKAFNHRRVIVCQQNEQAAEILKSLDSHQVFDQAQDFVQRPVVFMFSGQGTQYVNMGVELYQTEPTFREHVDSCCEILNPYLGLDLRQIIYPVQQQTQNIAEKLQQTAITQPALFVIEYALAQLWMSWGVNPQSMIGHSIGEYVSATIAGVFSIEDALTLVAARGKLMQQLPIGAMLAIPLSESQVEPMLSEQLSLAAVNGTSLCVVSGTTDAIEQLKNQLAAKEIECRRLHTFHAFHSAMMEAIVEPFSRLVRQVKLKPPQIPYISNITGTWITAEQATDPNYWAAHARSCVRFADGLQELFKQPNQILLEVGPGWTLTKLAKQHSSKKPEQLVFSSIRHPQQQQSDLAFLLKSLGQLWLAGAAVDWTGFYTHEFRHRLPLPTYPFERQRYWIEPQKSGKSNYINQESLAKKPDLANWFYLPVWKQSILQTQVEQLITQELKYLVFIDECALGSQLVKQLEQQNQKVITVKVGSKFAKLDENSYSLNPQKNTDYDILIEQLLTAQQLPNTIVHLWNVTTIAQSKLELAAVEQAQDVGFYSLLFLTQALGKKPLTNEYRIVALSNNMHSVIGDEILCPHKATLLGPIKVIPQEYANISCCSIDVVLPTTGTWQEQKLIKSLLAEIKVSSSEKIIAYRGTHRWIQTFEPVQLDKVKGVTPRSRPKGVYLITGGLGGIGLVLAEYLAKTVQAKLILSGRSALPHRHEWQTWLANHDHDESVSCKIRKLQELEVLGSEVLVVSADVTNLEEMQELFACAESKFGQLNGVIHAAGVPGGGMIQIKSSVEAQSILDPKVKGTVVLNTIVKDYPLDFFVLISSTTAIIGELGQVDYTAANAFLDAFTHYKNSQDSNFLSINWDAWQEVGMAVNALIPKELQQQRAEFLQKAISPKQGIDAWERILASTLPQVIVSPFNFLQQVEQYNTRSEFSFLGDGQNHSQQPIHQRPQLSNIYIAPSNDIEQKLTKIWQEILGIEKIGIYDNFFELDGHSLLATQAISRINKIFQIKLPLNSLFEKPTVFGISEYVEAALNEQEEGEV